MQLLRERLSGGEGEWLMRDGESNMVLDSHMLEGLRIELGSWGGAVTLTLNHWPSSSLPCLPSPNPNPNPNPSPNPNPPLGSLDKVAGTDALVFQRKIGAADVMLVRATAALRECSKVLEAAGAGLEGLLLQKQAVQFQVWRGRCVWVCG